MGSYKASIVCSVPQTPLERCIKDRKKNSNEAIKPKLGMNQVLSFEAENDLAEHCLLMKRKFFCLDNSRRHASRLPTCCKKRN
jgi:hypothetical protein